MPGEALNTRLPVPVAPVEVTLSNVTWPVALSVVNAPVLGVVPPIAPGEGKELVDEPSDTLVPPIVIAEFARLPLAIELLVVSTFAVTKPLSCKVHVVEAVVQSMTWPVVITDAGPSSVLLAVVFGVAPIVNVPAVAPAYAMSPAEVPATPIVGVMVIASVPVAPALRIAPFTVPSLAGAPDAPPMNKSFTVVSG
jgi:hypothetical protein